MAATIPPGDPRQTPGDDPGPEEQEGEVAAEDAGAESDRSGGTEDTEGEAGSRRVG